MVGLETTRQSLGDGSYSLAGWLFLRLLGLIYLATFVSLAIQIRGLIGRDGILPARELLAGRAHWGWTRFQRWPSLCWLSCTDRALLCLSWGGAGLAVLLVVGLAPWPILVLLWIFYLSLFTVGRLFLCYQWDILLLEAGWLAVLIAPSELMPHWPPTKAPAPMALFLFWWLLFRLMFWSGMVKLRSGDISWRRLTALQSHYETQPLPTPAAWYVHQLPPLFHRICAAMVLGIELIAPFFIFLPAPWKYAAAWAFIVLMISIQFTGNYAFFNLLGIALSLLLFDDHALRPVFAVFGWNSTAPILSAPLGARLIAAAAGILVLVLSLESVSALFRLDIKWPSWLARFFDRLEPFHLLSSYGLFAVMTTWRPEIILEGSYDRHSWTAYEFKWKPGDVQVAPRWVAPHQPRLDWQMWFLALGAGASSSWFERLRERLIAGSPEVLKLLKTNPFPDGPPRYVRGVYYDYRFTSWSERKATGAWWRRERRGLFEG
jgi:lipase maturation factor 1